MLYGHLATSALLHRYTHASATPVMIAGIFPDIIDKTLCYVLHLTSSGRMFGHTLLVLSVSTLIVWLVWGKKVGWSWGLGYFAHLVCDMGGTVPWLWPFVSYTFSPDMLPNIFGKIWLALVNPKLIEVVISIWAITGLTPFIFRSHKMKEQN
ncbi:MAG: hypothetical protein B6242_06945 [Anaerolineaceae bacterium 4572_78]|nr:MAG: hypothetical protein B6242_06945 [Anaerolineaceae bacterium 4572_78]